MKGKLKLFPNWTKRERKLLEPLWDMQTEYGKRVADYIWTLPEKDQRLIVYVAMEEAGSGIFFGYTDKVLDKHTKELDKDKLNEPKK